VAQGFNFDTEFGLSCRVAIGDPVYYFLIVNGNYFNIQSTERQFSFNPYPNIIKTNNAYLEERYNPNKGSLTVFKKPVVIKDGLGQAILTGFGDNESMFQCWLKWIQLGGDELDGATKFCPSDQNLIPIAWLNSLGGVDWWGFGRSSAKNSTSFNSTNSQEVIGNGFRATTRRGDGSGTVFSIKVNSGVLTKEEFDSVRDILKSEQLWVGWDVDQNKPLPLNSSYGYGLHDRVAPFFCQYPAYIQDGTYTIYETNPDSYVISFVINLSRTVKL